MSPLTHCKRGHEYTPENTYRSPSHPEQPVCRKCKYITRALRQAATPAESSEPNTVDVDGIEVIVSTEIPAAGPDADHPPRYHALIDGTDVGQVYQLDLITKQPTWFARHSGEQPTGPYPDPVAALCGLLAS